MTKFVRIIRDGPDKMEWCHVDPKLMRENKINRGVEQRNRDRRNIFHENFVKTRNLRNVQSKLETPEKLAADFRKHVEYVVWHCRGIPPGYTKHSEVKRIASAKKADTPERKEKQNLRVQSAPPRVISRINQGDVEVVKCELEDGTPPCPPGVLMREERARKEQNFSESGSAPNTSSGHRIPTLNSLELGPDTRSQIISTKETEAIPAIRFPTDDSVEQGTITRTKSISPKPNKALSRPEGNGKSPSAVELEGTSPGGVKQENRIGGARFSVYGGGGAARPARAKQATMFEESMLAFMVGEYKLVTMQPRGIKFDPVYSPRSPRPVAKQPPPPLLTIRPPT